ncbi:MAG: hypothetical protein OES10_11930 [Gammaproteobacteria bacterium]|nr:hypothetical protein [Gammaproteobacteria bacterium]MDH3750725.1 hypothetical protein [Gammaproteobacteria bacterium]
MSFRYWTATIVALFPMALAANAQDIKDHDPLFGSHDTLEVELEAPFAMLSKDRPDEEETAGKFRFTAEDGSPVEFDVAVRTRGRWRRNPDICTFPPLRLNFKKSQTKDTLFHKQDKLKLVTHCRNKAQRYEQSVVSEYLAYRILNLLTDRSFQVRLLKIRYVYTDATRDAESYAILIEHKDRLGKRIGGKPLAIEKARIEELRPADLNLASVFQYLIGNTDFSPIATAPDEDCCHNQALFASKDGLHYTIPFDFDQTGLVNAPHSEPNPRFSLRTVSERLYRGRCVNNDQLAATMQLFQAHQSDIESLVDEQQELSSTTRRYILRFIEEFYDTINNPKRADREIATRCI